MCAHIFNLGGEYLWQKLKQKVRQKVRQKLKLLNGELPLASLKLRRRNNSSHKKSSYKSEDFLIQKN
ncbi:MAG: hypothetical protein A2821_04575 [Candidatus Magasanikbacteria bacterium RIFCSPHIGHO2_01_FULL_41_23]|nr:MAG: hypothetical protein A2821_04575 [Candidatus Magasanikbacteria bacterium RIFCSPHIGHO2_01_FULL_41_23]OGH75437.1 MAG: hypothetical protein A3F22_01255 [Candidatus Magasanikbacteria bacterium RIFCSPHIGHO2_12_FULL_41_16]